MWPRPVNLPKGAKTPRPSLGYSGLYLPMSWRSTDFCPRYVTNDVRQALWALA